MDKAKAAVSDFLHKSGKHDTTVHEQVAPAVQNETVNTQKHENVQTAVDREVHQDHYHTSVQPIKDREVLPEQHHHNVVGVEHRKHDHDDPSKTKEFLERERAQFRDTTTTGSTQHTQSAAPTVAGEHVHHHVHENIQPVIDKETVQQHVVHTTVPVHEVHHNAAEHHSTSALPAMTMGEFKGKGGELSGRGERYDAFEGEPRAIGGLTGGSGHHSSTTGSGLTGDRHHNTGTTGSGLTGDRTTGTTGSGLTGNQHHNTTGSGLTGDRTTGTTGSGLTGDRTTGTTGSGLTGDHHHNTTGTTGSGLTGDRTAGTSGTHDSNTTGKPSLMDKLNPKVDANGDGKAGFMK